MTGRAHKEMRATQRTSGGSTPCVVSDDLTQPEAGSLNRRTRRNESSHEANDPLGTVDTDDRPRGVLPPHESAGQSSERVEALAPRLRRQVDNVDPQEREESQTRNSSDASEARGDLRTHAPSEEMQGTPLVVPDMRRPPAMDDAGVTATSCGSGVERTVQKEYHSVMLRDESLTPGPKATFPQVGQPSAKGKERADEQPTSSAERRFDETWLKRAMERMERRLQATIHSSLGPVSRSMNNLKVCVTAIEE